jgi:hypothetical protein
MDVNVLLTWHKATPCAQVCLDADKLPLRDLNRINIGSEHSGTTDNPGQPSYCTLPMFHQPRNTYEPFEGLGYTSTDGHTFECTNPVVLQQAFHV